MQLTQISVLNFVLKHKVNCREEQFYIPAVNSHIDGLDVAILQLIANGVSRDRIVDVLACNRRTLENRLHKLRILFVCNNTTHLMAKLAVIPISIKDDEMTW